MNRPLPKGLKLGVSAPAFQVDGLRDDSDKSSNGSWDEDAYKAYRFYLRDVPMIKWLGVSYYKFTISWSKVLPNGFVDNISNEGRDYYKRFIDALIARGIEPMVTMYHWDLPQNLQDLGGWTNPLIVDWFADYARVLFNLYGDKVKTWITINDPRQVGVFGDAAVRYAPGVKVRGVGDYLAAKHMVMAHAKAWRLYDEEFRRKQKGLCGIALGTNYLYGLTDSKSDVEAGSDAMDFEVGLYAHPIFSDEGGFPESVVRLVGERSKEQGYPRSRLPEFTEEERELVKGTSDFYGFSHYCTRFYTRQSFQRGMYPSPSCDDDLGAAHLEAADLGPNFIMPDTQKPVTPSCTEMPFGIRRALNWVKDTYNNPPILITANGYGNQGGLQDDDRLSYFRKYIDAVLDAVEKDQCNVVSYTLASLMDDEFELDNGLSLKFGLFETRAENKDEIQRARASAFWYRKLNGTRNLDPLYQPTLRKLTF